MNWQTSTPAIRFPRDFHKRNNPANESESGFTRCDLLTTIVFSLFLLVLLMVSVGRAGSESAANVCQENLRRLSLAWYMYATDHSDRLVYNLAIPSVQSTVASKKYLNWANNVMSWGQDSMITNSELTASSQLWPYLNGNYDVFRCPADNYLSPMQRSIGYRKRTRSYSMNDCLGSPFEKPSLGRSAAGISEWCQEKRQFLTLSAIPRPGGLFTFLEEHPDSINDGVFISGCADAPGWLDIPASFHDGACSFAFADGHTELHPWASQLGKVPVKYIYASVTLSGAGRDDFKWVLDRSSVALSELSVRRVASNQLQIIWSQLPTNYVFQVRDTLRGGWTNAPWKTERTTGQTAVRVPVDASERYFRLAN